MRPHSVPASAAPGRLVGRRVVGRLSDSIATASGRLVARVTCVRMRLTMALAEIRLERALSARLERVEPLEGLHQRVLHESDVSLMSRAQAGNFPDAQAFSGPACLAKSSSSAASSPPLARARSVAVSSIGSS